MPSQYVSLKDPSPMHRNRAIRVRLVRTYQIPELRGGQTSKSMELLLRDVEGTYIHANILRNDVAKYRDIFSEGKVVEIYAPLDKIIAGKSSRLMDFVIADTEQNTLKCTVWDDHVATMIPFYNADLKEPLIVVLQLYRAKIVNGEVRITSSYDATKLHCNESFVEFLEFKSKLVSGQSPVRSISTATVLSKSEGIGDFTSDSKMVTTISDLLDQKENGDFYVPAESLGIEGSGEWEVVEIVGIPTAILFEKFQKESAIPPELESLIGMDEELVSTYCTSFNDQPEKDLMSMLIEEDEDDEESDLEASWEDEVNSPGNARQMENNFTESEDCDTVKRYLMDEYSSSNKF
nr:replication factor A protein 1-like [Ipomoea batatas]